MIIDTRDLDRLLHAVTRRLGAAAAWRITARAAALAGAGLLTWALLGTVIPVRFPLRPLAAGLAAALVLLWPILAVLLRPSRLRAARIADRRAGLADRLGTAVELLAHPIPPSGLARLAVLDAIGMAGGVQAGAVAPVRMPREMGAAAAAAALLVLWAQFLSGWTIPGTPAGRAVVAIHGEGRTLVDLGRRLDEAARARGLPEARRAAPRMTELGHRLEASRISREDALGLLSRAARQLQIDQEQIGRRLDAALSGGRGAQTGERSPDATGSRAQQTGRLDAAVRAIQELTGQLRDSGTPVSRAELARRLAALSDSLGEMGGPPSAQRSVERARRDAEAGRYAASSQALSDAMQDLQGLERMLGDEQALGDARRDVRRSSERIAEAGRSSGRRQAQEPSGQPETSTAPGPNAPTSERDEGITPPPGPNQGSLPGQGTGPALGAPTQRFEGRRTTERLTGAAGAGTTTIREITGPGQSGAARRGAGTLPADVAHELDRALSGTPPPPTYLEIIRRYFALQGGAP